MRDLNYHIEVPLPLSVALVCFYLPVIVMGSVFNLISICVTLASPKLRSDPRNTFIVVLAFSDFFLFFFTRSDQPSSRASAASESLISSLAH